MVFRRDKSFDLLESWIVRCVRVQPAFQDKVSQVHVTEGGVVPSYMLQIITYFNVGIDRQAFAPEAVSIDVGLGPDLPPGQDIHLVAQTGFPSGGEPDVFWNEPRAENSGLL